MRWEFAKIVKKKMHIHQLVGFGYVHWVDVRNRIVVTANMSFGNLFASTVSFSSRCVAQVVPS